MTCKGFCEKYKVSKPSDSALGRYAMGQKRCSPCEIFIKWDGLWCPCCNRVLRTKPRNTPNRQRLQEIRLIKRI
jgi:hypothetical protein